MGSAPAAMENDFGYELEIPDSVSGAGLEYEFHELKTSGLGAGSVNDLFKELVDQVRRHAHPVGLWHVPSFQQFGLWVLRESPVKLFSGSWFDSGSEFDSLFKMCSSGMMTDGVITDTSSGTVVDTSGMVLDGIFADTVSGTVVGPSGMVLDGIFADTVPGTVVCSSGMVLDGIFADRLADQDSAAACGDSSSAAASKHAISIGSKVSNKDLGEMKEEKRVQFFVKYGSTSSVVRSSSLDQVSDVLQLHSDEYAVCGSRLIKMESTLSQNGIGNGSNVQVLRRLRGGAGAYLDIPGQWECKVCHATRCWPARKRCYRCDVPRDTVSNNLPIGPLGRAPPQSRSSGPPTRSSVPRHVPPRSTGAVSGPPPGAGVGPSPGNVEAEKMLRQMKCCRL